MKKKLIKKLLAVAMTFGGLLIFLFSTNPEKLSIGWLILPFLWLFIAIFMSTLLVLDQFKVNSPKRLTIAILTALIPSVALLLNSVNQLTLRDAMLVIIIGGIAIFYTSKLKISN